MELVNPLDKRTGVASFLVEFNLPLRRTLWPGHEAQNLILLSYRQRHECATELGVEMRHGRFKSTGLPFRWKSQGDNPGCEILQGTQLSQRILFPGTSLTANNIFEILCLLFTTIFVFFYVVLRWTCMARVHVVNGASSLVN